MTPINKAAAANKEFYFPPEFVLVELNLEGSVICLSGGNYSTWPGEII